jgi:hypothetical protein
MNIPSCLWAFCLSLCVCGVLSAGEFREATAPQTALSHQPMMRVGAAQPKSRLIDYHLTDAAKVLAQVDRSLGELEQIVQKAGAAKCDALAFPEDTPGARQLGGCP